MIPVKIKARFFFWSHLRGDTLHFKYYRFLHSSSPYNSDCWGLDWSESNVGYNNYLSLVSINIPSNKSTNFWLPWWKKLYFVVTTIFIVILSSLLYLSSYNDNFSLHHRTIFSWDSQMKSIKFKENEQPQQRNERQTPYHQTHELEMIWSGGLYVVFSFLFFVSCVC